MANRALAAKFERARGQRIEAGHQEYTKAAYTTAPKALARAELEALIAQWSGEIKKCPAGPMVRSVGKAGRVASRFTYGNGRRRSGSLVFGMSAR